MKGAINLIIDLSHPIHDGLPVYPGDRETKLERSAVFSVDGYNNHLLTINMHAGTHIDGHMHLTDCTAYINEYPPDTFIGEGVLLDVRPGEDGVIPCLPEYETLVRPGTIVLLHSGHSRLFGEPGYFTSYPVMAPELSELLVRKSVKMVGMDTPSPDKYPFPVHSILFRSRIPIIENLTHLDRLQGVSRFEVIALPLNIEADSSIARVIARVLP
ncbi:Kynurenine formamidase [compost metagenome]